MSQKISPTFVYNTLSLALLTALTAPYAHADTVTVVEKKDLGTLKADNSSNSEVYALSSDGKVAGGEAEYDNGNSDRAIIWSGENWAAKTDLGTLRADNSGRSIVRALSGDGKVAGGWAGDDNDKQRATLWRLDYTASTPTPPVTPTPSTPPVTVTPPPTTPITPTLPVVTPPTPTPPVVTPTTPVVVSRIDVENTAKTIAQLGEDSFALMGMQSHALDRLQYACNVRDGQLNGFCFGLQEDISISKAHDDRRLSDTGLGVNVGYGFGNGVSVGLSLDHSAHRKLPSSFKHDGDDVGVGAVVRYQSPNGYFGEISGAYDDYSATITRPTLANTEIGVNEATIKGKSYGAKVGKAFGTDDKQLKAYVGVKHTDISRDAYRENEQSAFPISYGKMQYKQTFAIAGVKTHIAMTDKLSWVSDVGASQKISGDDPAYTASLTGVEQHNFSHKVSPAKTQGHIATGLSYQVAPQSHVEILPYVNKNANGEHGGGALLRIESTF
ncbi:autotransporter domain-containing protein [Moraxella oblonga]|uniref:autotransporter domain-containing protein n=1 Tax=Moraxella oblonga TaxID=200413 RepID=UPI00082A16D6|nr:autotransporter outer membrane beta-barrel domain-containing protein [Moraxella oblonga]